MNLANETRVQSAVNAATNLARKAGSVLARPVVVGLGGLAAAGSSHAAGGFSVDVSEVVQTISGGVVTVSAIGIAVLSLVVVIKLFKWVQRTL